MRLIELPYRLGGGPVHLEQIGAESQPPRHFSKSAFVSVETSGVQSTHHGEDLGAGLDGYARVVAGGGILLRAFTEPAGAAKSTATNRGTANHPRITLRLSKAAPLPREDEVPTHWAAFLSSLGGTHAEPPVHPNFSDHAK